MRSERRGRIDKKKGEREKRTGSLQDNRRERRLSVIDGSKAVGRLEDALDLSGREVVGLAGAEKKGDGSGCSEER